MTNQNLRVCSGRQTKTVYVMLIAVLIIIALGVTGLFWPAVFVTFKAIKWLVIGCIVLFVLYTASIIVGAAAAAPTPGAAEFLAFWFVLVPAVYVVWRLFKKPPPDDPALIKLLQHLDTLPYVDASWGRTLPRGWQKVYQRMHAPAPQEPFEPKFENVPMIPRDMILPTIAVGTVAALVITCCLWPQLV